MIAINREQQLDFPKHYMLHYQQLVIKHIVILFRAHDLLLQKEESRLVSRAETIVF